MTHASPRTVLLQVSENDRLGSVTIEADTFERFEDEFEQRLDKLVETWKHMAAPIAQQIRRNVPKA
jgi:hypothetical protein